MAGFINLLDSAVTSRKLYAATRDIVIAQSTLMFRKEKRYIWWLVARPDVLFFREPRSG